MAGFLRQRKGEAMAVSHVQPEEDEKNHVHVQRVVRQGPFFGTLFFIGLLVPLIALRYSILPSQAPGAWRCIPMAFRSFAGILATMAFKLCQKFEWAAGRERWFASFFIAVSNMFTLFVTLTAELQLGADWGKCPQPLPVVLATVGCGVVFAALDRFYPKMVYRLGLIESHDPPTPYKGEGSESMNPYGEPSSLPAHALRCSKLAERAVGPEGLYSTKERMFGHALVLVRSISITFLIPIVENLFFREFLFELIQANCDGCAQAVPLAASALLWACYGTHYKGDILLRFLFGLALQALALSGAPACLWLPPVAAHGIRNGLGVAAAVATRKWHCWRV